MQSAVEDAIAATHNGTGPSVSTRVGDFFFDAATLSADGTRVEGGLWDAALLAQLKTLTLTAPVDGVVHELAVHAAGEIVPPGAVVARVVPTGVLLVATMKVPLVEIEAWRPGARVLLRFPGLDAETTPELWGTVTTVSAAPSVDELTGETSYLAWLAVDDVPMPLREAFVPGMPVDGQLQMGRRTVLSYLLKPMADQFARALKEE